MTTANTLVWCKTRARAPHSFPFSSYFCQDGAYFTPGRRARAPPRAVTTPPTTPAASMTPATLSTHHLTAFHRLTAFHARTTERAARAPRHDRHTTSAKNGLETGASPRARPCCPRRASRASQPRARTPAPNLARSSRARRFCSRVCRRSTAAVAGCSPPHARFAQPQSGAARQSCSFAQAPTTARAARRRAAGSRRRGEFNDAAARERVATLGAVRSADSAG